MRGSLYGLDRKAGHLDQHLSRLDGRHGHMLELQVFKSGLLVLPGLHASDWSVAVIAARLAVAPRIRRCNEQLRQQLKHGVTPSKLCECYCV